jgi:hypothetical protein
MSDTDMSPSLLAPLACRWNTADGRCGTTPARMYPQGPACDEHSPWARAGWPGPTRPAQQKGGQTG